MSVGNGDSGGRRVWFSEPVDRTSWDAAGDWYEVRGQAPWLRPEWVKTARFRIWLLRLVFPRREWVQIRRTIYWLRFIP